MCQPPCLAVARCGLGHRFNGGVHAFADEPAKRVLVHAIKTGRAPLRLLPPLILHDREGGKHTSQAEAILRGEASLGW